MTLHQNLKISQIRLSTFWFYLWRHKISERRKSNIPWLSTFFLTKWFLTLWKYFWRSDLFDFRRCDQINETFNVLTFWQSDFWGSDPLSKFQCYLIGTHSNTWIWNIYSLFKTKAFKSTLNYNEFKSELVFKMLNNSRLIIMLKHVMQKFLRNTLQLLAHYLFMYQSVNLRSKRKGIRHNSYFHLLSVVYV